MKKERSFYIKIFFSYLGLKTLGEIIFLLIVGLFLSVGNPYLLKSTHAYSKLLEQLSPYIEGIGELIILLFLLYIAIRKGYTKLRRPSIGWKDIGMAILGVLAIGTASFVVTYISEIFHISNASENQNELEDMFHSAPIMISMTVILFSPILEEFIFRKSIIGHIFQSKKIMGWLVSSIVFGLMHGLSGFTFLAFIQYTFMGMTFGFVYLKRGKIEASIMTHMLINIIATLGMF